MTISSLRTPHVSIDELNCTGQIVVFDTEFTAWQGSAEAGWSREGEEREIVQIGAVKVDAQNWNEVDAFAVLVKPVLNPKLSTYFVNLTGITQLELDRQGKSLADALGLFSRFLDSSSLVLSNGDDFSIIQNNCGLLSMDSPLPTTKFRSVQHLLPQLLNGNDKPISSYKLVDFVGPQGDEVAHQAISDARTIARTLRMLREQSRI